jgi:hypothetical protein
MVGQTAAEVASIYNVPESTVRSWKSRELAGSGALAAAGPEVQERIGTLLVEYLTESLSALKRQMQVFSDEAWLKKQSASEAAILHGVLADKTIRLLEALGSDPDDEAEVDPASLQGESSLLHQQLLPGLCANSAGGVRGPE